MNRTNYANSGLQSELAISLTNKYLLLHARYIAIVLVALCTLCMWAVTSTSSSANTLADPTMHTFGQDKGANAPQCGPNWTLVSTTLPNDSFLHKVASVSADDIWAVGHYVLGTARTLVAHWDGSMWSHVPSPNIGTNTNVLVGVTVVSADDIWAAGFYLTSGVGRTLTMHWNGTIWSIVTSPNVGSGANGVADIAAVSSGNVWAVGYSNSTAAGWSQTLILHWAGGGWTVVPSANVGTSNNVLSAVAVVSANDVWAVGLGGDYGTLVERWNGSAWSVVASPSVGTGANILYDVDVVSANNIWAVGTYETSTFDYNTLTMRWNGSVWSLVSSPNVDAQNYLYGVEVLSANNVLAVGYYGNLAGDRSTLVEKWNGTTWSVVTSIDPGILNILEGIVAVSSSDIWAVGSYVDGTEYQALVERYNPCVPSPTPSPTPSRTSTVTPLPTNTPPPASTPTTCPIQFTDVPPGSTFYDFVRCMACQGIVNGYASGCETGDPCFRPNNNVTRGQLAKIVSNAAGFNEPVGAQQYEDVSVGSTFFDEIWRLSNHEAVTGYACGGSGEPCGAGNLPYFRPSNNATRGQISKIIANAAILPMPSPDQQTFEDVAIGSTFHESIEALANTGAINGYACGGPGEPCVEPLNRPYFRPAGNATRGQSSKIVTGVFFPDCETSFRTMQAK